MREIHLILCISLFKKVSNKRINMDNINNRIATLQQVMSQMTNGGWADSQKLGTKDDFPVWDATVKVKLRVRGLGLLQYAENGIMETFEGATAAQMVQLRALMDEIIGILVFNSVKGYALQRLASLDVSGRDLYLFVKTTYGSLSIMNAIGLCNKALFSKDHNLGYLCGAFGTFKSMVVSSMSTDQLMGTIFLSAMSSSGFSSTQIKEVVNTYHAQQGQDLNRFDLDMVMSIANELFPSGGNNSIGKESMKIESSALVAKRPRTCYNCHESGHFFRECPKPHTAAFKELQAKWEKNPKGKSNGDKGWFAGYFGSGSSTHSDVFLDSGCSVHIFKDKEYFDEYTADDSKFITGVNGKPLYATGYGTVKLSLANSDDITVYDVLYIPDAAANLISITKATERGSRFLFEGKYARDPDTGSIIAIKASGDLYEVQLKPQPFVFHASSVAPIGLWHNRLGHPGLSALNVLKKRFDLPMKESSDDVIDCSDCLKGKAVVKKPKSGSYVAKHPLELIHADLSGPFQISGLNGDRYFLTIVDSFSNYVTVVPLKAKSEATDAIIDFVTVSEKRFSAAQKNFSVAAVRTDHGGEFVNGKLHSFFREKGIHHQLTVPHNSFQNGKAERYHRSLQEKTRTMMIAANCPLKFWPHAIVTACYLMNRTPTRVRPKTPFQLFVGLEPEFSHLRVFGCVGIVTIPVALRSGKLEANGKECMFLGYEPQHHGYTMFDPITGEIFVSNQVVFQEDKMFFGASTTADSESIHLDSGSYGSVMPTGGISGDLPPRPNNDDGLSATSDDHVAGVSDVITDDDDDDFVPVTSRKRRAVSTSSSGSGISVSPGPFGLLKSLPDCEDDGVLARSSQAVDVYGPDPANLLASPVNSGPEKVRNQRPRKKARGFVRIESDYEDTVPVMEEPEVEEPEEGLCDEPESTVKAILPPPSVANLAATCFMAASSSINETPLTYAQAMKLPNAAGWKVSFDKEWDAIVDNGTVEYVDPPPGVRTLKSRWVCVVKDGGLLKVRLVAKGYSQIQGIDYDETFAPVIRYESLRLFLSVAAELKLTIHQMDVSNAFLNGDLTDQDLYMEQPEGYVLQPGKVLKLKKSLYGLKQAPMLWNNTINEVLVELGFVRNQAEMGLYNKVDGDKRFMLGLYVDDILLASNCDSLLKEVKEKLMAKFKMKDLGLMSKFLGININQNSDCSIKLCLRDYIGSITQEYGLEDAKGEKIPATVGQALTGIEAEKSGEIDATFYRSIVGKLLFAANVARYDISFVVGVLSRYLQSPRKVHLVAAKKVLRYLASTKDYVIEYKKTGQGLVGYADADYANDLKTRRSTTGFIFKFGGAPVTWRSKLQQTVALSTTEAEFMSITEATKDGLWITQVLRDLGINLDKFKVFNDNQGAIKLVNHPSFHHKTKHIDVRLMFVRDEVQKKNVLLEYLSTEKQIADLLTKALANAQFDKLKELC